MTLLHLAAGLVLLVVINIVLGSIGAWLAGQFDFSKFWRGIVKGAVVAICIAGTWLAGWLNPDILAVDIGGQAVNLAQGIAILLAAAFSWYGVQVIGKLGNLFSGKVMAQESEPISYEEEE